MTPFRGNAISCLMKDVQSFSVNKEATGEPFFHEVRWGNKELFCGGESGGRDGWLVGGKEGREEGWSIISEPLKNEGLHQGRLFLGYL